MKMMSVALAYICSCLMNKYTLVQQPSFSCLGIDSPAVSDVGTDAILGLTFCLSLQVECTQLQASNKAAQKQEAQHKWKHQKQLRQVEFDRDVVKQRELTCELHERRGLRCDESLRAREKEVEGDRVGVENARAVGTAELKRVREAYFFPYPKDKHFQRLRFSPTTNFYSLALSTHSHLLYAFDVQTLNVRMANMVARRKDANKEKRQANKNLKQQGVMLSRSQSANATLRDARESECKAEYEAVR